jgi:hypothetical protein
VSASDHTIHGHRSRCMDEAKEWSHVGARERKVGGDSHFEFRGL